jgi:hypothetical protein
VNQGRFGVLYFEQEGTLQCQDTHLAGYRCKNFQHFCSLS